MKSHETALSSLEILLAIFIWSVCFRSCSSVRNLSCRSKVMLAVSAGCVSLLLDVFLVVFYLSMLADLASALNSIPNRIKLTTKSAETISRFPLSS